MQLDSVPGECRAIISPPEHWSVGRSARSREKPEELPGVGGERWGAQRCGHCTALSARHSAVTLELAHVVDSCGFLTMRWLV